MTVASTSVVEPLVLEAGEIKMRGVLPVDWLWVSLKFFALDLSAKLGILGSRQPNAPAIRSNSPIRFSWNPSASPLRLSRPPRKTPLPSRWDARAVSRAAALAPKKRTQIAAKGAKARWEKK
jgi:hypothetical protein